MFKSKGDRLESLIQYVYQTLSELSYSGIKVKNKFDVIGKSGTTHNIDVFYEFVLNGIIHRVIFECKNWNTKVSKEKVLTLKAILDDIPNSVGIMVSPKGFQSGAKQFAEYHGIELISGNEQSLLAVVAQKKFQVILPDESVVGEPFYCLMEKVGHNQVTGTYIRTGITEDTSFLVLCFSRLEAEELASDQGSVVRGIDQRHLEILCNYSDTFGLKVAIKKFLETQIFCVETKFIREYFL